MRLCEFYQEEPGSSFTHNGKEYLLNPLIKFTEKYPIINIPVDLLKWVIKYDKPTRDIDDVDITEPVLVHKMEDGRYTVIDGLHRLIKSIRLGRRTIPVKLVDSKLLSYFEI
jgi:hypothetical protein